MFCVLRQEGAVFEGGIAVIEYRDNVAAEVAVVIVRQPVVTTRLRRGGWLLHYGLGNELRQQLVDAMHLALKGHDAGCYGGLFCGCHDVCLWVLRLWRHAARLSQDRRPASVAVRVFG